jgi:hypothetical protein
MINTVSDKIMGRIQQNGQRWVFTPTDFFDLGNRTAVYSALVHLVKDNRIRRISRGLYDVPRYSQLWDEFCLPDDDAIIDAIARQAQCAILPSGAMAANQLGLSLQVPAKLEYVWSKPTKKLQIGNLIFVFRYAPQSWVANCGHSIAGVILQALDWLGVNSIDYSTVTQLARFSSKLSKRDRELLRANAPDWVVPIINRVALT